MTNRVFATGNNLIHGDAMNEGMKIGTGATQAYSWADLKGHYIVPPSGTTAGTWETWETGVTELAFNATDIIVTHLHLEHCEVIGGIKYIHPHIAICTNGVAATTNLVLTHVIKHQYQSIGAGDVRGSSPAAITITQTITPTEINAIGAGNQKAFDIEYANTGGTGGKLNSSNMYPDDKLLITTTVTSIPTITGTSTKIALLPIDAHREVIDGSGTKNKDRTSGSFYGTNA